MIYVDNAATTRTSDAALQAMLPYFSQNFANASSLHAAGQTARDAVQQARETVARVLNAQAPGEIYFTSGGTEADNMALRSAAMLGKRKGKMHIISTAFEHHAVLHMLEQLEKQGFTVTLLDVHENGVVTADQVQRALRDDTCLVSIMYANNEIGTVQPIAEIGRLCRARGVLFHTDAVQAVGHLPIDVQAQCIDLLSLSGHKFHGPKGVGALYARRGVALQNVIFGGAQERGRRPGTENVPAIVGMAVALQQAADTMAEREPYVRGLRDRLIAGLGTIEHAALNGDAHLRLSGNVNFCFEGIEGESLLLLLDAAGICASSGSACTSASLDASHVLLAIGRPHDVAHGSLRLTLNHENTPEEVDTIVQHVAAAVQRLRTISPLWKELQAGKRPHLL